MEKLGSHPSPPPHALTSPAASPQPAAPAVAAPPASSVPTSTAQSTVKSTSGLAQAYPPVTIDPQLREKKIQQLKSKIQCFPDFPKAGVVFWDIFSALSDGPTCTLLQSLLIDEIKDHFPRVQAIVGLESRGFLFSFSLAAELGIMCIPVRKKGKLPGEVSQLDYKLEYGSGTLEVQKNIITPNLKCLIIDDLIATGGSITAAAELLRKNGADVIGCLAIMELTGLKGRENIPHGIPVKSLIVY